MRRASGTWRLVPAIAPRTCSAVNQLFALEFWLRLSAWVTGHLDAVAPPPHSCALRIWSPPCRSGRTALSLPLAGLPETCCFVLAISASAAIRQQRAEPHVVPKR